ncbi:MAG: hypothetical protein AAB883_02970 [Patescibacteria group bacterium]
MSRESMLIVLGIVTILSPFSGFPSSWLMWFYLFAGLVVTVIGVTLRLARTRRARKPVSVHEAATPILS